MMRNKALAQPLKDHPAYKAHREAALVRLAVETPDCLFEECSDCCYLERRDGMFETSTRNFLSVCPECGGRLLVGVIANGEIHA